MNKDSTVTGIKQSVAYTVTDLSPMYIGPSSTSTPLQQAQQCAPQMGLGGAGVLLPPPPPSTHHHYHRRACHRRAKSAGNAFLRDHSHYAATGLYAHQSGENIDKSNQLWTLALPKLKKTSSENTLHLDAQSTLYAPYYFIRG